MQTMSLGARSRSAVRFARCIKRASNVSNMHQMCIKRASNVHQTCLKRHQTCIKRAPNVHQACTKRASCRVTHTLRSLGMQVEAGKTLVHAVLADSMRDSEASIKLDRVHGTAELTPILADVPWSQQQHLTWSILCTTPTCDLNVRDKNLF